MKVNIPEHSRGELTKLRCFLSGYHAGKGDAKLSIPGEMILAQLIIAIDKHKEKK